jgi:hypothetical protein
MIVQKNILPKSRNNLETEILNLFHSSNLPLHFNKTGNKEFTNYQRVSIIILYTRSKKSLREFLKEFKESKWVSWLDLFKIPGKSTLHDWLVLFDMKIVRKLNSLIPDKPELTAIDGTGFDSWQRSRHYEKRIGEVHSAHMPYAKSDLFVDVKKKFVLDYNFITHREHDVKGAERIFKRYDLKDIIALGDKGFDSNPLHELVRNKGGIFYAPVRNKTKLSLKNKPPKGKYRRECLELPEFMGMRSIVESIISVIKRTQITALRSKKSYMKKREFGWHMILYNIKIKIKLANLVEHQTFFYLIIFICPNRTNPIQK